MIKFCEWCEKEFETDTWNKKYCSDECKKKQFSKRKIESNKFKYSEKAVIERRKKLAEIQRKAWELGMDYGNYVARHGDE